MNSSRFVLHGYTINPITEAKTLHSIINGLCSYEYKISHICDFDPNRVKKHINYLGSPISVAKIEKIQDNDKTGLIATQFLTNGYFTIKIWENITPSLVRFDLYLDEKLDDIDLILDHLTSPAIPDDGLGLFDYTYSLTHDQFHKHPLQKYDKKMSSYFINDKIKYEDDEINWSITLNELDKIECHFCSNAATQWIIISPPWLKEGEFGEDYNFITVTVCSNCVSRGRKGEIIKIKKDNMKIITTSDLNYLKVTEIDEFGNKYTRNDPQDNHE
jgi:hypothetical protein